MSEWIVYKLSDVADKIAMGPFGSNIKVETFKASGIPIISGMHLHGIQLLDKDFNYISEEHAEKLSNSNVFRHDVIFTHAGTIGQVSYIPDTSKFEKYIISQRQFYLRCNPKKLDYKYITYYFKSPYGQYLIDSNTNQTGVPSIAQPATFLKNAEILLPPLPEQKAIAGVLSSLDDKIDLLHRQNKTLEAMAEVLFRQWFVEPCKDGLPEGWREGKLSDVMVLSNGKSRPNTIGYIPVYGGNGILDYTDQYNYDKESIIIGRVGAYCGSLFFETNKIWVSDNALHAKARNDRDNYFLFYLLKTLDLNSFAEGSSHPLLTQTLLNSIDIAIPPNEKRQEFDVISKMLNSKIINNLKSTRTLEMLRNTLLPKLMSGEVRVAV
jgi:type I restriction enzyme S subunit